MLTLAFRTVLGCKGTVQFLLMHRNCNTICFMKSATIPPVRVEPAFRREMEQALGPDENLASLVETAVRNEVSRRQAQAEFVRRGLASIQKTVATGTGIPAHVVIEKLQAKLAAAKKNA